MHGQIINGEPATVHLLVNGQDLGSAALSTVGQGVYNGVTYTSDQTFTFKLAGLQAINSLQVVSSISSSTVPDIIYVGAVNVNGVVLANPNANWNGTTDTIDATAWNNAIATQNGKEIDLSATGYGSIALTNVSTIQFTDATVTDSNSKLTLNLTAANASSDLDSLEKLISAGSINTIYLTDSGTPTITVSAAQFANDTAALKALSGSFNTVVTLPSTSATIHGGISGLGTVVEISSAFTAYTVSAAGDGITEVQFNDASLIVASQSATGTQAPTSAQVTELYGAVFGRLPDVGGLGFYEQTATKNQGIGFLTYAEWFLNSPEYTSAHSYAANSTGDAQFITDSYQNLLGRAPAAGDIDFYETKVINPIIAADLAAGKTMAQAELEAHAQVLVYFSASPEFTNDVSTTGTGTPAFGGHHWLLLV
jgi:hypothetical protein